MPETDGPFLSVASFVDMPIEDKTGTLSLIRMIDRSVLQSYGEGLPEEMPKRPTTLTLVVGLKSGAARGRHTLSVKPEAPSGLKLTPMDLPVHFEGEDRGQNFILHVNLTVEEEGLYWFDIYVGAERLTRVPLRFLYERFETRSGGLQAPPP